MPCILRRPHRAGGCGRQGRSDVPRGNGEHPVRTRHSRRGSVARYLSAEPQQRAKIHACILERSTEAIQKRKHYQKFEVVLAALPANFLWWVNNMLVSIPNPNTVFLSFLSGQKSSLWRIYSQHNWMVTHRGILHYFWSLQFAGQRPALFVAPRGFLPCPCGRAFLICNSSESTKQEDADKD